MNKSKTLWIGAIAVAAGALAGCDVQKTAEGNVQLPEYKVEKTQSGDVTLPKYDVTAPDVNVTTREKQVEVPKVHTETETIRVPSIDIKTGQEKAAEKRP